MWGNQKLSRKNKEERQVPKNFDDILSLEEFGYIYTLPTTPLGFKPKPTTIKVKWTRLVEQKIDESFKNIMEYKYEKK